jgi:hypothetical protein
MIRWVFLLITALYAACSGPSPSLEKVLPSTVSEWKLAGVTPISAADAPALVRQLGLKQAVTATYQGPRTVKVRVYEMNVATSAFELIQKWRQQDGPAVYSGQFFIVADAAPEIAAGLLDGLRRQLQK